MNAVFALAGFLALAAPAPPPTLAESLRGTWRLVSYERKESPEAPWTHLFGDDPKGYLMYDRTGHMMVEFEKMPPRPQFASGDEPTADEALAVYRGYVAYFGRYTVDEKARAVTHHVEGSLNPAFFGTDQLRPATLQSDRLTLSDGKTYRVVWERVR